METGAMLQRKQVGEFLDWDLGKDAEAIIYIVWNALQIKNEEFKDTSNLSPAF